MSKGKSNSNSKKSTTNKTTAKKTTNGKSNNSSSKKTTSSKSNNNNNSNNKKKSVVAGETTKLPVITEEVIKEKEEVKKEQIVEEAVEKKNDTKNEEITKELIKVQEDKVAVPKEKNKKLPTYVIAIIIVAGVILCLTIILGIIVCVNKTNTNVYKNIFLEENDISKYTSKDLEELIDRENEKFNDEIFIDIYQDDKKIRTISSKEIDYKIDKESVMKDVMSFGRSGNIFLDNIDILKVLFSKHTVKMQYKYNKDSLDEILKNIDVEIDGRFIEDTYNIDEKNKKIIIKRGIEGNSLVYEVLKNDIIDVIKSHENGAVVIEVEQKSPIPISAKSIYEDVKREPQNAVVDRTKSPIEIKNEIYGIDFKVDELQNILDKEENKEYGKEIEFEIDLIEPEVKLRDISSDLCLEKIAGLTTYFDAGQYARANNLKVALSYLNDIIIMPGEVFSYNAIVGDTTAAKGYMSAAIFKGGRVVNEMGGGICQTSSTLYNVALLADLEIVERHAHGLPVGYVRPSLDATVYGDILDFKFKNTRSYPLKIVTSFSSSGEMNISLYGTKEKIEYDIELKSNYLYTVNYTTEYIQDPNLAEGQEVVDYNGVNGYASEAYFVKKLNGEVIETRYLSKDIYSAQIKTVRIGTKKNEYDGQS